MDRARQAAGPALVPARARPRREEHSGPRLGLAREPPLDARRRPPGRAGSRRPALPRAQQPRAPGRRPARLPDRCRPGSERAELHAALLAGDRRRPVGHGRGALSAADRCARILGGPACERRALEAVLAPLCGSRPGRQHEPAGAEARAAGRAFPVPDGRADGRRRPAAGERPHLQHLVRQAPHRDDLVARGALRAVEPAGAARAETSTGTGHGCPRRERSPAAAACAARAGPRWSAPRAARAPAATR